MEAKLLPQSAVVVAIAVSANPGQCHAQCQALFHVLYTH